MANTLAQGSVLRAEHTGQACTIVGYLGAGGQGEVYRARLARSDLALKWYLPGWDGPQQRLALLELIRRGPPGPAFLWPVDLVSAPETTGFGYLMLLREERFCSFGDLMRRQVEPSFRTMATVGLNLADGFLQLHAAGLCYRDISFGNLFFDPHNGDVLVCDNDNVGVDGVRAGGILGTPRFMAPEIVRGETWPDSKSDLWSLGVLLFYLLFMHHPLEGQRERNEAALDALAMQRLFGTEPIFIFDPSDDSNRPVPGEQDNATAFWAVYPALVRRLFTRAFTDGLADPQHGRIREGEWRHAMVALRDSIVYCGACGGENFAETGGRDNPHPVQVHCWDCSAPLTLPFHLRLGRTVVMLNHDTHLYPHHLQVDRLYDFSQPLASVVAHPNDRRIWGLRNEGHQAWIGTRADGTQVTVAHGQTMPLQPGGRVNFGQVRGEVGRDPVAKRAGGGGSQ